MAFSVALLGRWKYVVTHQQTRLSPIRPTLATLQIGPFARVASLYHGVGDRFDPSRIRQGCDSPRMFPCFCERRALT